MTTGSLRLTSLNLALGGLTGQMTYLHLFNFSSLIGMNTHNHFVRHVNPLNTLLIGKSSLIMTYDSFIFYFLSFKLVFLLVHYTTH